MEIHSQKSTILWGFLEEIYRNNEKETLGRAYVSLEVLQTIVIGVELILNDQPLMYFSDNICDPVHLTHRICCMRDDWLVYLMSW